MQPLANQWLARWHASCVAMGRRPCDTRAPHEHPRHLRPGPTGRHRRAAGSRACAERWLIAGGARPRRCCWSPAGCCRAGAPAAARSMPRACASPKSSAATWCATSPPTAASSPPTARPCTPSPAARSRSRSSPATWSRRARRWPRSTAPNCAASSRRKQATLASLEAEAGRAALDAQTRARRRARKLLDQAADRPPGRARDLERNQRALRRRRGRADRRRARAGHAEEGRHRPGPRAARITALQGQGAGLDTRNKRLLADRQRAVVDRAAAPGRRAHAARAVRWPGRPGAGRAARQRRRQRAGAERGRPVASSKSRSRCRKASPATSRIGMPAQITSGSGEPYAGAGRRRCRRKWSTAKSPRACASTASSRRACARTSA